MNVKITTEGGKTTLISPYNPDLPGMARKLGGRFDRDTKAWRFDARDEDRVRDLARSIYGTDGTTAPELVTVHLDLDRIRCGQTLWFAGRQIAHRPHRDEPVRLGDEVVIVQGDFRRSGGSMRYPELSPADGTVLEVRDLPRPLVYGEDDDGVTIVDTTGPDVEALRAERARLLDRVAEIDALLNGDPK